MRKNVICALVLVLGVVFGWAEAGAQLFPENHYLVYEVPESFVFDGQIMLIDQFNDFTTNLVEFDKFANPVEKNGEPIFDDMIHQTWWMIDDPMPPCTDKKVGLDNQFGYQEWVVGDGRFLVLPAYKNMPAGWPDFWNHYKCYDAVGPAVDRPVQLIDQFGAYSMIAVDPVLFCNPCQKDVNGIIYPMVEPETHLAVYRLEQGEPGGFTATASDQFGVWQFHVEEPIWLVLPTIKLSVVGNETSTWGSVKSLFR